MELETNIPEQEARAIDGPGTRDPVFCGFIYDRLCGRPAQLPAPKAITSPEAVVST